MTQKAAQKSWRCPLEYGLDIFSGKWKTRVICLLGSEENVRYSHIRDSLCGMTDAVLAATLREMLADKLIERQQYNEIPPRVEYRLTEKGKSAHDILRSICRWAVRYTRFLPGSPLPPCKQPYTCILAEPSSPEHRDSDGEKSSSDSPGCTFPPVSQ